jgi:hypothetical protein
MMARLRKFFRLRYSLSALLLAFVVIALLCGVRSYRVQRAHHDMQLLERDPRMWLKGAEFDYVGPDEYVEPLVRWLGFDPVHGNEAPPWVVVRKATGIVVGTPHIQADLLEALERFADVGHLVIITDDATPPEPTNLSGLSGLQHVTLVGDWIWTADIAGLLKGCHLKSISLYDQAARRNVTKAEWYERLAADHPDATIRTDAAFAASRTRTSYSATDAADFRVWLYNMYKRDEP